MILGHCDLHSYKKRMHKRRVCAAELLQKQMIKNDKLSKSCGLRHKQLLLPETETSSQRSQFSFNKRSFGSLWV